MIVSDRPRVRAEPSSSRVVEQLLPAVAVVATALLVFGLVRATGGLPNSFNNLSFLAIIIGSLGYGVPGGLSAAILVAALLGPIGSASGMEVDSFQSWLTRFSAMAGVGVLNGLLVDRARRSIDRWRAAAERLSEQQRGGMLALARAAEAKDEPTGDHLRRVQVTAGELARATGASSGEADEIAWAAMLHDIGKLHLPDSVLRKPGPLSPEEWQVVRTHSVRGAEILAGCDGFETARRVARWHHENVDGSGYPDGLRGSTIPLEARIVRVADAFDAMTNDRPYSRARSAEDALEELDRYKEVQFDPALVAAMEELVRNGRLLDRLRGLQVPDPMPVPASDGLSQRSVQRRLWRGVDLGARGRRPGRPTVAGTTRP